MEICPARLEDAEMVAQFNIALALESEGMTLDPAIVRAGVEAVLRDSTKGIYFTAREEGRPVGVLMVTNEWSDWRNGNFWWLQSVYVAKSHRGQGVFKAILNHVLQAAQSNPAICGLRLYVDDHNVSAQDVYRKLDFKKKEYQILERLITR